MNDLRALRSTPDPVLTWVRVREDDGRVRMEMRWHVGEGRRQAGTAT